MTTGTPWDCSAMYRVKGCWAPIWWHGEPEQLDPINQRERAPDWDPRWAPPALPVPSRVLMEHARQVLKAGNGVHDLTWRATRLAHLFPSRPTFSECLAAIRLAKAEESQR